MAKTNQARKITTAVVGFNLEAVRAALESLKKDETEAPLYTIIGIVNGAKPGATDKGDYVRLVGSFKATNLHTGDVYQSGVCILPNFLGEPLGMAAMKPGAQGVQFALTMKAKKAPKSVAGFEYTAESVLPVAAHDPLAVLEETLKADKLLPAPKK